MAMLRIALPLTRVRSFAWRICSWRAAERSWSRPENRSSIPRSASSSTSRRMVSENRFIKASTSSRGRDQFSVEKAYRVKTRMPRLSAASATRRIASIPALCPITRGSSRSRAHRLLPSMMIATCSGGGNWLTRWFGASDLHDFGFFARRPLIDEGNETIGELLQLLATTVRFVGRNLLLLLEGLDAVHLLATDVAHRHVRALRVALHESRVFPPALFIQRRDRDADQLAVVAGVQSQLRLLNRLLDGADDGPVPRLDQDHACLGHGDGGQLVQGRRISVVLHRDLVHQRRAGPSSPDRQDLLTERFEALLHLGFSVFDVGFDHAGAPTIVPICLPAMTPSRFPLCERSNTMMGMLFSRQRVTAVWSITRRSLLIRSR